MGKHVPQKRRFLNRSSKDRSDGLEALEKMGIAEFAHRKISDLSGGQRQRVLIARALVTQPDLLVLDEPTASIDSKGQNDFYHLLQELNKELTIIMVSHDLLAVSAFAKSVACVNKRLHYHQSFASSGELLDAIHACSVYEACPVTTTVTDLREQNAETGVVDA